MYKGRRLTVLECSLLEVPHCVTYVYNRYAFEGEKMCKIMWAVGTIVWQPVNFLKLFPTTQEE